MIQKLVRGGLVKNEKTYHCSIPNNAHLHKLNVSIETRVIHFYGGVVKRTLNSDPFTCVKKLQLREDASFECGTVADASFAGREGNQ